MGIFLSGLGVVKFKQREHRGLYRATVHIGGHPIIVEVAASDWVRRGEGTGHVWFFDAHRPIATGAFAWAEGPDQKPLLNSPFHNSIEKHFYAHKRQFVRVAEQARKVAFGRHAQQRKLPLDGALGAVKLLPGQRPYLDNEENWSWPHLFFTLAGHKLAFEVTTARHVTVWQYTVRRFDTKKKRWYFLAHLRPDDSIDTPLEEGDEWAALYAAHIKRIARRVRKLAQGRAAQAKKLPLDGTRNGRTR